MTAKTTAIVVAKLQHLLLHQEKGMLLESTSRDWRMESRSEQAIFSKRETRLS